MKKKNIIVIISILLILIIGTVFFLTSQSKKSSGINGSYLPAKENIRISIKDNYICIKEEETDALYNQIYKQIFNENMNKERFEEFVVTAIENLEKGVEYSNINDILYVWPVQGDEGSLKIHLLEDGTLSLYNVVYKKVDK